MSTKTPSAEKDVKGWINVLMQVFIALGTLTAAGLGVYGVYRTYWAEPEPAVASAALDRLRWAAADGGITAEERQALEAWVKQQPGRRPLAEYLEKHESNLLESAREAGAGDRAVRAGDLRGAAEKFEEALYLDPDSFHVLTSLGAALTDRGEPQAGRRHLDRAITLIAKVRERSPQAIAEADAGDRARSVEDDLARAEFLAEYNLAACLAAHKPPQVDASLTHLGKAFDHLLDHQWPEFTPSVIRGDLERSPHFESLRHRQEFVRLKTLLPSGSWPRVRS